MKTFTLRVVLLAAIGMLALSGCANSDLFSGGGGDSAAPPDGCISKIGYCQTDPLKPRSRNH